MKTAVFPGLFFISLLGLLLISFSIFDFFMNVSFWPLLLLCWKTGGGGPGRPVAGAMPSLRLNPKGSARAAAAGKPERR